jgi:phage terminase large subunit GpA-like protein
MAKKKRRSDRDWLLGTQAALRPPPKLSLSEWADEHFVLSAESAAEPGRWKSLPYQRGILDAITDPAVERVSLMKSARVGYTKCINAAIGYYIHQDPCPILVVQPTVEDAEGYSKEEIAPMLRDCDVLADLVKEPTAKTSAQTILHKSFPGGVLSMVGANSGRGFRRVSRRVVIFDEVDGYPPSAGTEGDQIKLGERRSEYYWNRKLVAGSTPLVAGASRIEELFQAGDRRRYFVPCPHCGQMDFLRFNMKRDDDEREAGHVMRWAEGKPDDAHFLCRKCGGIIEETSKRAMIEAGEWRAEGEFCGHASFHIWAAYSLSPNATWGQIANEFLEAKKRPETLKTFVNTTLGETWKDRGEAPDWEILQQRRESYPIGSVPEGPIAITVGVDVQKDRLMYEVVGWAASKESWSIEAGALLGDTSVEGGEAWKQLDTLLARSFPRAGGGEMSVAAMGVDSGYNTQVVYNWSRRYPMTRVFACKGVSSSRMLVGAPSPVDVTVRGKRLARGYKVWPIGVDIAKGELYGWLRMRREDPAPPGYCHFPEYGDDFFQQITAEHLVTIVNRKTNRAKMEWQVQPNRDNHFLDARILARAAASIIGIDRMRPPPKSAPPAAAGPAPRRAPPSSPVAAAPPAEREPEKKRDAFWRDSRRKQRPRGGWFGKRR